MLISDDFERKHNKLFNAIVRAGILQMHIIPSSTTVFPNGHAIPAAFGRGGGVTEEKAPSTLTISPKVSMVTYPPNA